MTKKEALEILRETIRQARIERDAGSSDAHDRVLFLTRQLQQLSALKGADAKEWIAKRIFY